MFNLDVSRPDAIVETYEQGLWWWDMNVRQDDPYVMGRQRSQIVPVYRPVWDDTYSHHFRFMVDRDWITLPFPILIWDRHPGVLGNGGANLYIVQDKIWYTVNVFNPATNQFEAKIDIKIPLMKGHVYNCDITEYLTKGTAGYSRLVINGEELCGPSIGNYPPYHQVYYGQTIPDAETVLHYHKIGPDLLGGLPPTVTSIRVLMALRLK